MPSSELSSLIDKQLRSYDDVEKGDHSKRRVSSHHGETLLKAFARQRRMLLAALVALTVVMAMYTAFSGLGSFQPKEIVLVEAEEVSNNGEVTQVMLEVRADRKEADEFDRLVELEEQQTEEQIAIDVIKRINADDAEAEEELREEMEEQASVIEQVLNDKFDDDTSEAVAAAEAAINPSTAAELAAELLEEEAVVENELIEQAVKDGSDAVLSEEAAFLQEEVEAEASSQAEDELEDELASLEARKVPGGNFEDASSSLEEVIEAIDVGMADDKAATAEPTLMDEIEAEVFGDDATEAGTPSVDVAEETALDALLSKSVDEQMAEQMTMSRAAESAYDNEMP